MVWPGPSRPRACCPALRSSGNSSGLSGSMLEPQPLPCGRLGPAPATSCWPSRDALECQGLLSSVCDPVPAPNSQLELGLGVSATATPAELKLWSQVAPVTELRVYDDLGSLPVTKGRQEPASYSVLQPATCRVSTVTVIRAWSVFKFARGSFLRSDGRRQCCPLGGHLRRRCRVPLAAFLRHPVRQTGRRCTILVGYFLGSRGRLRDDGHSHCQHNATGH